MLRAYVRALLGRRVTRTVRAVARTVEDASREQLALELLDDCTPRTAEELRGRLVRLGLDPRFTVKLTRNRVTVVSYRGDVYRIHQAFLDASTEVLKALVTFVMGRTRRERIEARKVILAYPITREPVVSRRRGAEQTHPDDEPYVARLHEAHARLNAEHFDNTLRVVQVRVSRRMIKRLGHYVVATAEGLSPEIAISRRHLRRDTWGEVLHTLLHEMVHQWQDEHGMRVDHGASFRRKAREVGIAPSAVWRRGGTSYTPRPRSSARAGKGRRAVRID